MDDGNDIDLRQFDGDFASAQVEEREFDEIPDGKYQVVVDRVEITKAKSSGNPMLRWTLKILGPRAVGRLLWRNNVMATRENLKWLKGDLHTCGLDLDRLSNLPGQLERLLDVKLEVTKRSKGDNTNIYFNKRIVTDEPVAGTTAASAADDDIPF